MSKRWLISVTGVTAVLGCAAYLFVRSQPKPATNFQVAIRPAVSTPMQAQALKSRPAAEPGTTPPATESSVQAQPMSLVPVGRRKRTLNSGPAPVPHIQPAVEYAPGNAPEGQPPANSEPGITEARNSGPAPDVAVANATAQGPNVNSSTGTATGTAPATPASAVLLPHGSLVLNGKPTTDSTALFAGDQIEVPAGSYASINSKGSLTVLQPGASAVYTGHGLHLRQGGLAVSTNDGMPVDTEGLTIAPQSGNGKYDVLNNDGTVQIASLQGALNVTDGGQTTVLPEGQQTTRQRKKAAGMVPSDTPTTVQTAPEAAAGGFPTTKVLIIGGLAAGGAVAAILLTRSSSKPPASPAVP